MSFVSKLSSKTRHLNIKKHTLHLHLQIQMITLVNRHHSTMKLARLVLIPIMLVRVTAFPRTIHLGESFASRFPSALYAFLRPNVVAMFVNVASSLLSVPRCALQPFGPPMLEPPPRSALECELRELSDRMLDIGYANDADNSSKNNMFSLPESDKTPFSQYLTELGPNPSTYGEVTTLGARQLFYYMGMTSDETQSDDDIVFYDLGMGRGKLVVQALLEINQLKKSKGVELSHTRYQAAVVAWQTILRERSISVAPQLTLYHADLFAQDLHDATHIYVASLCFSDSMMESLAHKLADLNNLRCIATLKQLPSLQESRAEYVEMTWTMPNGCQVYFYDFE